MVGHTVVCCLSGVDNKLRHRHIHNKQVVEGEEEALQSLKKLSQCFELLERVTWHKSHKLCNIMKIIYLIV